MKTHLKNAESLVVHYFKFGNTLFIIEAADTDARLDINEMSAAQLEAIPGIGEMLAKRIVAYRDANGPFHTLEEVMNVEGIGEKKLDQIASLVKVGG